MSIEDSMLGPTGPMNVPPDKDPIAILKEIRDVAKAYEAQFKESTDKQQQHHNEIKKLLKINNKNARSGDRFSAERMSRTISDSVSSNLGNFRTPMGSGRAAPVAGSVNMKPKMNGAADGTQYGKEFASTFQKAIGYTLGRITTGMLGGSSLYQLITKDMIEQEYEFAKGMDVIAFQTKSITADAPKMQKAFRATAEAVATTGFDLTTYQNQLTKSVKKGVQDSQDIVKTGLNLGRMMNLNEQEASGISDMFEDWSLHLGMDDKILSDVSRGIQAVARYTGLVGQNLVEVVKNSEKFLDKMRDAGTLTAQSAKNIILLGAEAKKLGIEGQFSEFQSGITNVNDLYNNISDMTRSILFSSASLGNVLTELQTGTMAGDPGNYAKLAGGMEQMFKRFSGGKGVDEIDRMSPQEKANFQLRTKGIGVDTFKREIEAFKNAGLSFQERMKNVDKELGDHATKEELRTAALKKQQMIMDKSFEFTTELGEAAKKSKSFDEAIQKMQQNMTPEAWKKAKMDLSDVAGTFSTQLKQKVLTGDNSAIAQAMALSASKSLKDAGGTDYSKQLRKAISGNDIKEFRTIQTKMNKEQQKLGVGQINKLDPLAEAAQYLKEINETLRSYTGPAINRLMAIATSTGIIAFAMGNSALNGYLQFKGMQSWFELIKGGITGKFGKGAAGGTAGAAGGAGATAAKASLAGGKGANGIGINTISGSTKGGIGSNALGKGAGLGKGMGMSGNAPVILAEVVEEGSRFCKIMGMVGKGLGFVGKIAGKLAWPLTVLFGAFEGLQGAFAASANAAELFSTKTEDLTTSQTVAARGAGFLTGILNFLTLGFFDSFLGSSGIITKMLANFFEPIMDFLNVFDAPMKELGTAFGDLWTAMKEVGSAFGDVFSAIMSIFDPITDMFKEMGGGKSILVGISKALGHLVKFALMPILKPLQLFASIIAALASALATGITYIKDGLNYVKFGLTSFADYIRAKFTSMWTNITTLFSGLWDKILSKIPDWAKGWLGIGPKKEEKKADVPNAAATPTEKAQAGVAKQNRSNSFAGRGVLSQPGGKNLNELAMSFGQQDYLAAHAKRLGLDPTDAEDLAKVKAMQLASGGTMIPMASPAGSISSAQPMPLADVHQKMQAEQAGMAQARQTAAPEFTQLVSISEQSLNYLMMIHDDLKDLNGLMKPSGKLSGLSDDKKHASTRSQIKPPGSTNYNKMQFGRYAQNASVNVITDGIS